MHIFTKIIRVLSISSYRRAAVRTRVAASTEHDSILKDLRVGTVVDIGANRGQFALCARRLFPTADIYSFEPLKKPAEKFFEVFKNDSKTRLIRKAIASESGAAAMHVSQWDVSSSLLPIGEGQHRNFPFTRETRVESVEVARLADCIEESMLLAPSLLKIDVQGSELCVLQGCESLLDHFTYIYAECSFIELYVGQALAGVVVAYLQSKGFDIVCVANLSYGRSARPIQADFLFARR